MAYKIGATLLLAVMIMAAGCITPAPTVSPISQAPTPQTRSAWVASVITDALTNGGMNLPYSQMPGYSTISIPRGWSFAWKHPICLPNTPDCPCPTNCTTLSGHCNADYSCSSAMPETSRILAVEYGGQRTLEGNASAKVFANRQWEGAYIQRAEVGSGNLLTFTAYLQAWMCFEFSDCVKNHSDFGQTWVSDKPTTMHLRVGIDPTGGTVFTSTNIVWSAEGDAYRIDKNSTEFWHRFTVTATAQSTYATVFIYGHPDWSQAALDFPSLYDGNYARASGGDLYVDKATLEVLELYPIYKVYLPMVRR